MNPIVYPPTPGRIVWYYPGPHDGILRGPDEPLAAIVVKVWGDRMVNLAVFDSNGNLHQRPSVALVQEGDEKPEGGAYCTWMPYQAKKHTEELAAKA